MKKYAINLTKNNQEKILATYANAEDAFLYGGKVSNELPRNAGTVSCIYADGEPWFVGKKASSNKITVSEMNRIDAEVSNSMQVFNNAEFGQIRTVIIDGEPMFCLTDVCKALDISNVGNVKSRLSEKGIRTMDTLTAGGKQKLLYITEANLYKTIFQSRKKSAERFTDWVISEVLPSIRKTGSYFSPQKVENILLSDKFISLLAAKLQETQPKTHDYSQQFADTLHKAI